MKVYNGSFYIMEEKRFAPWAEYIAFYKEQDQSK